jgi:hydroxymethylpyrimidine/phosphomethylpyrimidine kinase
MKVALTIAGSDSGGGAGIQADLKTFAAHGVFGTSAITAVTVQNTLGVSGIEAISPETVAAQIRTVFDDFDVAAAKTGMLFTAGIIEAVVATLRDLQFGRRSERLVVDPVMVASSGDRLLEPDAESALIGKALPAAWLVTPNIAEAAVITGRAIESLDDMRAAARCIFDEHGARALVKGGHIRPGGHRIEKATDVLYDGETWHTFTAERLDPRNTHGTGCTLSAAIAANLALGRELVDAVREAKAYVTRCIRHAPGLGHGTGPMNHFPPDE